MHDQIEDKHVLSFFQKHDLIPASRACNKCKRECVFKEGNKKRPKWKHWKCTKCNNEFGAQGRFFEHYDKLLIVVAIIYMLMHDYPIRLIKHELNVKGRGKNVHDMIYNLGKVASKFLKDKFRRECGTWGANPDEHVQIDEAAVGHGSISVEFEIDAEGFCGLCRWCLSVVERWCRTSSRRFRQGSGHGIN
jgi:hypothetical protein